MIERIKSTIKNLIPCFHDFYTFKQIQIEEPFVYKITTELSAFSSSYKYIKLQNYFIDLEYCKKCNTITYKIWCSYGPIDFYGSCVEYLVLKHTNKTILENYKEHLKGK